MKTPLRKLLDNLCGELGYNYDKMLLYSYCRRCQSREVDVPLEINKQYDLQKELILDEFEKKIQDLQPKVTFTNITGPSTFTPTY